MSVHDCCICKRYFSAMMYHSLYAFVHVSNLHKYKGKLISKAQLQFSFSSIQNRVGDVNTAIDM